MLSDLENSKIIITTRDGTMIEKLNENSSVQISLEPFEEKESIDYLEQNLKKKN